MHAAGAEHSSVGAGGGAVTVHTSEGAAKQTVGATAAAAAAAAAASSTTATFQVTAVPRPSPGGSTPRAIPAPVAVDGAVASYPQSRRPTTHQPRVMSL